jgi:hypothetical protein
MLSITFKNTILLMTFALSALITNVDAVANCNTEANPQCCWVRQVRTELGGNENSIPKSGCCGKNGVVCSEAKVTQLNWVNKGLDSTKIPTDRALLNLPKLEVM